MVYTFSLQVLMLMVSLALTSIVTLFFRHYALKKGIMDIPNDRSSHTIPTPRGGGVSVVFIFISMLILLLFIGGQGNTTSTSRHYLLSLIVGGGFVAVTGFWDDHQSISTKWRFLMHLVSAGVSLWLLPVFPQVNVFGWPIDLGVLGYPFFMLMLVWLLNLYNFMDGIDGIASVEAIFVLSGAAFILWMLNPSQWIFIMLLLSFCVAGFLVFNWPPAKIFMGDACSGFLGFILGLMAIITSTETALNLWSWLILLGVFVVDATVTLIRRVKRGDTWHEPHRSHAYQILSRRYNAHKPVTLGVLTINILWLLPLALLAALFPSWGIVLSIIAITPLVFLTLRVGAGIPEV